MGLTVNSAVMCSKMNHFAPVSGKDKATDHAGSAGNVEIYKEMNKRKPGQETGTKIAK
jgi:hypothetical protein